MYFRFVMALVAITFTTTITAAESLAGHLTQCGLTPDQVVSANYGAYVVKKKNKSTKLTHSLFITKEDNGQVVAMYAHGVQKSWKIFEPTCFEVTGKKTTVDGETVMTLGTRTFASTYTFHRDGTVSVVYKRHNKKWTTPGTLTTIAPNTLATAD